MAETLPADTDLVLCDLNGLRTHGVELSALRVAQHPRALLLILLLPRDVPLGSLRQEDRALVDDVIRVPVDTDELRLCVTYAIRMRAQSLAQEQAVLFEQRLVGVVGHDMRSPLQMLAMLGSLLAEADDALPLGVRGAGDCRVTFTVTLPRGGDRVSSCSLGGPASQTPPGE